MFAALRTYFHSRIAAEINTFARYYDRLLYHKVDGLQQDEVFRQLSCSDKAQVQSLRDLPQRPEGASHTLMVLDGTLNCHLDIQKLLTDLAPQLNRFDRVVAVLYNPYLRVLYQIAERLGLNRKSDVTTFLTRQDLHNLARISGFELVRSRPAVIIPFRLLGLGRLIETGLRLVPGSRFLAVTWVSVLRRLVVESGKPSLTVVIPARNERGNIEHALRRMPKFGGAKIEVIFVEGHSKDQTWEEIGRVAQVYGKQFQVKAFQQQGKGKNDAVRLGFAEASGEVLTILDADLTMPPELLERFYDAYCQGQGNFVNGSRLLYPMEGQAMRFLNLLGNLFFAKALSSVLDISLTDTLCGTKLLSANDYRRVQAWRDDFGDFDPFGDFELIFPAAVLGLSSIDIPVRYRDRTYGTTNIHRFSHGLLLLRMTLIGLFRIKLGFFAPSATKPLPLLAHPNKPPALAQARRERAS